MSFYDFKDKVILITGAGRGIGRAIAEEFALYNPKLVINYNKNQQAIDALAKELTAKQIQFEIIQADVSNGKSTEKMIDRTIELFGRIDVLVNNAGIRKDNFLAMMSDEEWDSVMQVNLKSMYNTCKWVSRIMIRQRQGKIINLSSVSALSGVSGQTNYSASKGAIISFTKSLARELAPYGIQVNSVVPGLISTDMTIQMGMKAEQIIKNIPMQRLGLPKEVAKGVVFLASNAADYLTGNSLVIDGGLS